MLGIRKGNLFFMNEVLNLFSCPLTSIMIYIRMGLCFIIEIIRRGWFYYHDMFLIICFLIDLSFLEYELGVFNIDIFQGNDIFVYCVRKN